MKKEAFKKSLPAYLLAGLVVLGIIVFGGALYDLLEYLVPENTNYFP